MDIYLITTIRHPSKQFREDGTFYMHRDCRCVGFADTREEGESWVLENVMDINENGYYPLAVVEKSSTGIYSFPDIKGTSWFEWDEDDNKYTRTVCPEEFKQIVGFGIG